MVIFGFEFSTSTGLRAAVKARVETGSAPSPETKSSPEPVVMASSPGPPATRATLSARSAVTTRSASPPASTHELPVPVWIWSLPGVPNTIASLSKSDRSACVVVDVGLESFLPSPTKLTMSGVEDPRPSTTTLLRPASR